MPGRQRHARTRTTNAANGCTEGRWIASRQARHSWQPELQPPPSHNATGCGAVAAATCTGGVGLRPPCYDYQHACEDEAQRCDR
jgi:hypothetical protein